MLEKPSIVYSLRTMKHGMHSGGHHHGPMQSVNMTTDAMSTDIGMEMDMNMKMDMGMKMDMMATSFHLDPKLTLLFEFWRPDSEKDVYLSYLILFSPLNITETEARHVSVN